MSKVFLFIIMVYSFSSRADMADVCRQAFRVTTPFTVRKNVVKGLMKLSRHERLKPIVEVLSGVNTVSTDHIKPDIEIRKITDIKPITPELGYIGPFFSYTNFFQIGFLKGEKVFLKPIVLKKHLLELSAIRLLVELEVPILFKGVTQAEDGTLYMVSYFQEGVLVKVQQNQILGLYKNYNVTEETRNQLSQIKKMFLENGILPLDFQFLISKEGDIYLIDFDQYIIAGKRSVLYRMFMYQLTQKIFEKTEEMLK